MERIETVEFTNMCMICDGSRVIVMELSLIHISEPTRRS